MPYDDSDVKKMIKYQTERKVGFSRSKRICDEVKDLIHCILEAQVDRRYTVQQIMQHPWIQQSAAPAVPSSAAARTQTPAATVATPSGAQRVTIIAGDTGATGGRVGATATPAAVGNDTVSQNNNSNVNGVLSRILSNFLNSVNSFFAPSTTDVINTTGHFQQGNRYVLESALTGGDYQEAVRYAMESAIDRERLRQKANMIWAKRRPPIHLALRRAWR